MYGIGFDCLLFHFAPPHPPKEGPSITLSFGGRVIPPHPSKKGAPSTLWFGGPLLWGGWGGMTGPPNESVMGGPRSKVCLGAPEGVNPPLKTQD